MKKTFIISAAAVVAAIIFIAGFEVLTRTASGFSYSKFRSIDNGDDLDKVINLIGYPIRYTVFASHADGKGTPYRETNMSALATYCQGSNVTELEFSTPRIVDDYCYMFKIVMQSNSVIRRVQYFEAAP